MVGAVSATDEVRLRSGGGSVLDDDDNSSRIVARALDLNAGNGTVGTATSTGQMDTDVQALTGFAERRILAQ